MANHSTERRAGGLLARQAARGFTLVELAVVLGIVGVLAALSIPKYYTFVCRAKTTEARSGLRGVYVAEETYRAEHDTFIAGDETVLKTIGVNVPPNKRYQYSVLPSTVTTTTFEAHADSSDPGIPGDHWSINQDSLLIWVAQTPECI